MRVIVQFTKALKKRLSTENLSVEVYSYRDVIEACKVLVPGMKTILDDKIVLSLVCDNQVIRCYELDFKVKSSSIFIVPAVCGGATTSFDSLGNLNIFYGTTKAFSSEEMLISGLNRRIVDSSLFGQAQTAFDISQRKSLREDGTLEGSEDPTTGFGSLNITSAYGQSVPLHFGLVRVGGAVVNSYIKHIQRGSADSVRVADYV